MNRKNKFKEKGSDILKDRQSEPKSMKEFIAHSESLTLPDRTRQGANAQIHQNTYTQNHNLTKIRNRPDDLMEEESGSEEIARLHVHIRKDLADKLLETVFIHKRDKKIKRKQATQRAIIEKALEAYFEMTNRQ